MKTDSTNESNISIDEIVKKADKTETNFIYNWEIDLMITIHGASELAIMPDDHPFVEVGFEDLPKSGGQANAHRETVFKTHPAPDAKYRLV